MYNSVSLLGNLTEKPELRYSPQGTPVCTFRVATNRKTRDSEERVFMPVVVFGKKAENCAQYLDKGKLVFVQGRLREKEWEYQGEKHRKLECIADTVQFLSGQMAPPPAENTDFGEQPEVEPF